MKIRLSLIAAAFCMAVVLTIPQQVRAGCLHCEWPSFYVLRNASMYKYGRATVKMINVLKADNVPAVAVFLAVAGQAGVHLRVGVDLTGPEPAPMSVNRNNIQVHQALAAVSKADGHYALADGPYGQFYPVGQLTDAGALLSSELKTVTVNYISPVEALKKVLSKDTLGDAAPKDLAIEVIDTPGPWETPKIFFTRKDITMRDVLDMIGLAADRNWIARVVNGKLQVRLFDKAVEVVPEVAKVTVELEDPTPPASDPAWEAMTSKLSGPPPDVED